MVWAEGLLRSVAESEPYHSRWASIVPRTPQSSVYDCVQGGKLQRQAYRAGHRVGVQRRLWYWVGGAGRLLCCHSSGP